jgi:hypothetical protein
MNEHYRIHVSGLIEQRWTDWLGGLVIHHQADGTTLLIGQVVDQAALHGVIARIRDLGLPLLAVDRVAEPDENSGSDLQPGGVGDPE